MAAVLSDYFPNSLCDLNHRSGLDRPFQGSTVKWLFENCLKFDATQGVRISFHMSRLRISPLSLIVTDYFNQIAYNT
jgi:hypothetical protein